MTPSITLLHSLLQANINVPFYNAHGMLFFILFLILLLLLMVSVGMNALMRQDVRHTRHNINLVTKGYISIVAENDRRVIELMEYKNNWHNITNQLRNNEGWLNIGSSEELLYIRVMPHHLLQQHSGQENTSLTISLSPLQMNAIMRYRELLQEEDEWKTKDGLSWGELNTGNAPKQEKNT